MQICLPVWEWESTAGACQRLLFMVALHILHIDHSYQTLNSSDDDSNVEGTSSYPTQLRSVSKRLRFLMNRNSLFSNDCTKLHT